MEKPKKVKVVPLDTEVIKGVYCDGFGAAFSESIIVLDFAVIPPRSETGYVVSRILVIPSVAKGILKELEGVVREYEKKYGKIKVPPLAWVGSD